MVLFLAQWFSESDPQTSTISIIWEFDRNANSPALLGLLSQKLLGKAQLCVFNKPPGDSDAAGV